MQIFTRILKELGIAILFMLLILAILAFAFRDKVPYGTKVPDSIDYANIDKKDYDVRGDVEDKTNPTQTYQTSTAQLEAYLTEKIVSPGRFAPFDPIDSVPDVPSETILNMSDMLTTDENGNVLTGVQNSTTESTLE